MDVIQTPPSTARVQAFVQEHKAKGFSPSDTLFLAHQHALFDRGHHRALRQGPLTMWDILESCQRRMSQHLAQVQTPHQLLEYRKNWLALWGDGGRALWGKDEWTQDEPRRIFNSVYDESNAALLAQWMDLDLPASSAQSWDEVEEGVAQSMLHTRFDVPIIPGLSLQDAMRQTGLHTLTWSSWRQPDGEESLASQLVAFNHALQKQTGLHGAVLGLAGLARLHIDDDMQLESEGCFNAAPPHNWGKTRFGRFLISLSPETGLSCLAHEWMHAFDTVRGGYAQRMDSERKASNPIRRCIDALEDIMPGQDHQGVDEALEQMRKQHRGPKLTRVWREFDRLDQERASWEQWQDFVQRTMEPLDNHSEFFIRSLALAGALRAGETDLPLHIAWRDLHPSAYFSRPREILAYCFEEACEQTHLLPTTAGITDRAIRRVSLRENRQIENTFKTMFSDPQLQATWAQCHEAYTRHTISEKIEQRRKQAMPIAPDPRKTPRAV